MAFPKIEGALTIAKPLSVPKLQEPSPWLPLAHPQSLARLVTAVDTTHTRAISELAQLAAATGATRLAATPSSFSVEQAHVGSILGPGSLEIGGVALNGFARIQRVAFTTPGIEIEWGKKR